MASQQNNERQFADVSILEQLPLDALIDMLLYDPVLPSTFKFVSKVVKQKMDQVWESPGFFKAAVKKCFPLISHLPTDMIPEKAPGRYKDVLRKQGQDVAENYLWKMFFYRLLNVLLAVFIEMPLGVENLHFPVQEELESSFDRKKYVTCSMFLDGNWTLNIREPNGKSEFFDYNLWFFSYDEISYRLFVDFGVSDNQINRAIREKLITGAAKPIRGNVVSRHHINNSDFMKIEVAYSGTFLETGFDFEVSEENQYVVKAAFNWDIDANITLKPRLLDDTLVDWLLGPGGVYFA